ncbi:MAG TPA: enoyl-CoA hydratase [Rhodospirillales bacterium]|nr:enoyl-CoA hydratase [Rhodospirillales bacterium]
METLDFSIDNGVARIVLNRPGAGNTLNGAMGRDLMEAALQCDEDPAIRAVLLTGAGDVFCFGGDLKHFVSEADRIGPMIKQITTYLHSAISRFIRMQKPMVVAVNGTAAGAGVSLSALGDVVLAGESATFTAAYTAAGLSPDGGSTYLLPRLIGMRRAQELFFTNRKLSAAEAADWGLITRVVPDGDLMAEAEKLVNALANGPTAAFGTVKTLLAETMSTPLESQLEQEARGIARNAQGADGREGVRAFVEKRAPVYTGE